MKADSFKILLADDDEDDCMFFKDALDELSLIASFNTVGNGEELMSFLEKNLINLPHVLFLDLNMPRKSGFECLNEIKQNEKLKQLPVIIYSTTNNPEVMDLLYTKGAHHYIRKPAQFEHLKSVIKKAISLSEQSNNLQPSIENFVIQP
ncbi:MAG: response regulator [Bacteroidota bacterium]